MTFIGLVEGTKDYIFMRSPNNIVFTAIQALFDETLFPKCPNMHCPGYTPVGLPPDDLQGEHNGPLDYENEDYGGGGLPPLPPIPYHPVAPQGPPAARQQPPITPQTPIRNPQHPLGWRRVTTRQGDLDNPDNFKWVLEHHTPKSFLNERKQALKRFPLDYEKLPAFWLPSPSPPTPPRPLPDVPSPAPANMNPPLRRSGRIRQPVFKPDNVYGNQPSVDILQDDDEDPFVLPQDQSPGSSGNQSKAGPSKSPDLAKMVQDGGAGLINFLLRAAVSSADAKGKIPKVSKVREWHFRDLMHLPKATQEEWKIACKEELEALHQHNVFKLTDLPKGHKTIGCRWVFDVK
jgi:hypothetical protein